MKTYLPVVIVLLFPVYLCFSQPDSLWSHTYGGEEGEFCYSVIQTDDGGFALAGNTFSFGAGGSDFWLVKTDSQGDSIWSRTYGGEGNDECYSAIQTTDCGFALAGWTSSIGAGSGDFWFIKTDSTGDTLWSRNYGGIRFETCNSLIQTSDDGFALGGYTESFGAEASDFLLIKTDSNGDTLWSKTYGGESYDICNSIIQTSDGGFALAGLSESFGNPYGDLWFVKTDSNGDSLWSFLYGDEFTDKCYSVIQSSDDGYALAGYITTIDDSIDYCLVKIDDNGELLWANTYDISSLEECHSVIQTADNGFALAGTINNNTWLLKTNSDGDSLWSKTIRGGVCYSAVEIADNEFAFAGYTELSGAGHNDFWLTRFGAQQSVNNRNTKTLPDKFIIENIYPNPFNSATRIRFILPYQADVTLAIYNVTGKEIVALVNGYLSPGIHMTLWNPENLASGVYFAKLLSPSGTAVQKLTLIR